MNLKKFSIVLVFSLIFSFILNTNLVFAKVTHEDEIPKTQGDSIVRSPIEPDDLCDIGSTRRVIDKYNHTYCNVTYQSYLVWQNQRNKLDTLQKNLRTELTKLENLELANKQNVYSGIYNGGLVLINATAIYASGGVLAALPSTYELVNNAGNLILDMTALSSSIPAVKTQAKVVENLIRQIKTVAEGDAARLESNYKTHINLRGCLKPSAGQNW